MLKRLRSRLTYANVASSLALLLALSTGTAYAANTVFSEDIVNGEVKTPDLANLGVTAGKLARGAVTTGKLANLAVTGGKLALNSVGTGRVIDETLTAADLGPNSVTVSEVTDGAVTSAKILDGEVGNADLADDAVDSAKIADGSIQAGDISSAPPFGTGGFNGDEKIIDGTVSQFDIGQNQISEFHIADSVGSSGSGTDTGCFDDDGNGEVCASTTFTLADPGKVLLVATGQWRTFSSPPVSMACVLQADGTNVGLAQSFGEIGSNHTGTQADGTMALTGLTGTLSAGSHTFQTFCTQTDADMDLLSNQITAARVDG